MNEAVNETDDELIEDDSVEDEDMDDSGNESDAGPELETNIDEVLHQLGDESDSEFEPVNHKLASVQAVCNEYCLSSQNTYVNLFRFQYLPICSTDFHIFFSLKLRRASVFSYVFSPNDGGNELRIDAKRNIVWASSKVTESWKSKRFCKR